MIELLSSAEMAEADRLTIAGGVPGIQLMERAGTAIADAVLARFPLSQDTQPPAVIAGTTPAVSKTDVTLSGQVVDNLSGVANATRM